MGAERETTTNPKKHAPAADISISEEQMLRLRADLKVLGKTLLPSVNAEAVRNLAYLVGRLQEVISHLFRENHLLLVDRLGRAEEELAGKERLIQELLAEKKRKADQPVHKSARNSSADKEREKEEKSGGNAVIKNPFKAKLFNGFTIFLKRMEASDKTSGGHRSLEQKLGIWRDLTKEEKRAYKDMAKEINETNRTDEQEEGTKTAASPSLPTPDMANKENNPNGEGV